MKIYFLACEAKSRNCEIRWKQTLKLKQINDFFFFKEKEKGKARINEKYRTTMLAVTFALG